MGPLQRAVISVWLLWLCSLSTCTGQAVINSRAMAKGQAVEGLIESASEGHLPSAKASRSASLRKQNGVSS